MTRRRIMILYAAVCGVLTAAAALALLLTRTPADASAEQAVSVTDFGLTAFEISIEHDGETVTLTSENDIWILDGDASAPADQDKAGEIARAVSALPALRAFEPEAGVDYGFEFSVTASNAAGETAELEIGAEVPGTDARYVRSGGTVYTVGAAYAELFRTDFLSLLEWDSVADFLPGDLVSLCIEHSGFELELLYDESGQYESYEDIFTWFVGRPYDAPEAADTRLAHALYYDVTGLYIYGCAAYRPDSFSGYGFDEPMGRITLIYREEDGAEVTQTITLGGVTEDGYVYVRIDESDEVLLANASIARQLVQTVPSDLAPRQVCGILLETVTRLTVRTADAEERVFEGSALEEQSFASFYEALTEITSSTRAPDTEITGSPVLEAVFERNTGHDAQMTLAYYEYSGEYYIASFNGRENQLVSRSVLDEVLELYRALS